MVDHSQARIDGVFQALSHGARRDMLRRLAVEPMTVGELAEPLEMTLAGASKHVKVLERCGLVRQTKRGRHHVCHLRPQPLAAAADWLDFYEAHWNGALDALGTVLNEDHDDIHTSEERR